jgi:hypothetical protein
MKQLSPFLRFPLTLVATAMFGIGCGGAEGDLQPQTEPGDEEMISSQLANLPDASRDGWLAARNAIAKYRDVNVALAEGYVRSGQCYEGKGVHYVNYSLIFGSVAASDPNAPEVLMYVPDSEGNWKLVAAEYAQVEVGQPHPSILGQLMDGPMAGHTPSEPVHYDVHVWLFKFNRDGFFAGLNPTVKCPPGQ